ncbi:RNA polymerase sigma factor [Dyella flava]|uniref:RNA polymerase sigma factor n=1 Tax=Dyella flava TaxID=1920170 RepID=A0ABS2K1H8_9GAMM|nr:sigma-70 family RNA polymerase sigma factor [Dyella flava]MBM7124587.1 sigma-70 family RNA polymerase sigma factor [Dyella flava]GLQ49239.1 RNA polymerase sigma factor [Dyella flava]
MAMNTVTLSVHVDEIEKLFREHNRALVAFLQCRLSSLSDAQEVAQEAYLRVLTMDNREEIESLRSYLFKIAGNLAIDRLRKRKVRSDFAAVQASDEPVGESTPVHHAMAVEQVAGIRRALRELPAKASQAFVMHVIEGRDFGTVAQTMNLSERMVRYHVANALAHCRARVDEKEMP